MKPVIVQGVTYSSLKSAAEHFGLVYAAVHQRVQFQWSLEEALELIPRVNQHGIAVEIDGVAYDTIKDAATAYNISASTVRARLNKGWTIKQAVGLEDREGTSPSISKREIEILGVSYLSIADAARRLGKDYAVVCRRIGLGWSVEEAFDATGRTPKHDYPGVIYKIKNKINGKCYVGVTMRTIEERWQQHVRDAVASPIANKSNGLREAIVTHGSTAFAVSILEHATNHIEMQALEVKWIKELNSMAPHGYNLNVGGSGSMPNINHAIKINGQNFPSIARAIQQLKISIPYQTIVQRLQDNWTPEQAFGLTPHVTDTANWGATQRAITVNGTEYRSLAEASRQIPGSPPPTLAQNRLSNGWTPEEAFNVVPHADQRGRHPAERDVLDSKPTLRSTTGYRGVSKHQMTGKWQAAFSARGKRIFVGLFDDAETANDALQMARQKAASA